MSEAQQKYSNVEIVNLVVMALLNGNEDSSDPIIVKSWQALDDTWKRGRQEGYAAGYQAGLLASGEADVVAVRVIEGMCKKMGDGA